MVMSSPVDELPAAAGGGLTLPDPAHPGADAPRPTASEPPLTVLRPAPGWQGINVGELWRFHELIFFLACAT